MVIRLGNYNLIAGMEGGCLLKPKWFFNQLIGDPETKTIYSKLTMIKVLWFYFGWADVGMQAFQDMSPLEAEMKREGII